MEPQASGQNVTVQEAETNPQPEPEVQSGFENTSPPPPPPKRGNLLMVLVMIVLALAMLGSAVFIIYTVRQRLAEQNTISADNSSDSDIATNPDLTNEGNKMFIDQESTFSFEYPENYNLETNDKDLSLTTPDNSAINVKTLPLTENSVQSHVENKLSSLSAANTDYDITRIGSRAGYEFTHSSVRYMFFPLGLDSVLEIEITGDVQSSELEEVVQSIEFLPLAQTS